MTTQKFLSESVETVPQFFGTVQGLHSTHLLTVVAPEMMDGGTDEGPMDAAIAAAAGWAPGPMP